ncbi:methionine ABC transporter permease MetI [Heliobacterium gestii]|uniref:Methionine ABC transporter permease MetI n=1 Tax=Heliomicrobium gestii TaxID=2699 RepID=A0A845LB30_HELGE|nr:methionine ABC transporter permease [Heliomicrobium gestii]MBM7868200.1 D-methionine transport system permease protein [Heliomicrobium gestii]MZP43398.1 methionine ABC transporter permease MetI [Heliomicrobium gestii]
MTETYLQATWETFYMVIAATGLSTLLGIPLGILLVVTERSGVLPNRWVNTVLAITVNIFRSIPFIILLVAILPLTKLLVGSRIGTQAAIVPLTVAAVPFVARVIEASLKEIDKGIIEAARAMGATPRQIIQKVLLPEALPGLLLGVIITFVTLIGYSAMAGAVGGGGLGDLAIREGYMRNNSDVTWVTVVVLVAMVQVFQSLGDWLTARIRKRRGLV